MSPVLPLPVLVVEDDDATALLQARVLRRSGTPVSIASTVGAALDQLEHHDFSAVLADFRLPDGDVWPVVDAARKRTPPLPVVVVTALGNEGVAAAALDRGSSAYVIKSADYLSQLPDTIHRVIARSEAEQARARLAAIVSASTDGIVSLSRGGVVESWNPGAELLFGYSAEQAVGRKLQRLLTTPSRRRVVEMWATVAAGTAERDVEVEIFGAVKAVPRWVSVSASPIRADGRIAGVAIVFRDISARKAMERELIQAHKLEAVGRLAGGVAHDFNNMLSIVLSGGELLMADLADAGCRSQLKDMLDAAARAARLTRQLLAFARRQPAAPQQLNVNDVITGSQALLEKALGHVASLSLDLASDLDLVELDPAQLDQILMNLTVNARDALAAGGVFTLATRRASVDGKPWVVLVARDSGIGMVPEIRDRIFEPFFTTKRGVGGGTGLGLSVVYGVVEQAGGRIEVITAPDRGTTFEIWLPAAERSGIAEDSAPVAVADPGPVSATILLVDDEDRLRFVVARLLRRRGYTVLEASSGSAALDTAREHGPVDILVTDVLMPGMNGRELAETLAARQPDLKVLFMSGYSEDVLSIERAMPSCNFIHKPFPAAGLASAVSAVLKSAPTAV